MTTPGRAIGRITRKEIASRPKNRKRATANEARRAEQEGDRGRRHPHPDRRPQRVTSALIVDRLPEPFGRQVGGWPREGIAAVERVDRDHDQRDVDEGERDRTAAPEQVPRRRREPHRCSNAPSRRAITQVDDHHDDRHHSEGRRQRQVVGVLGEDDVADELGVRRDQGGRDVVAEGQREGEDRAGHDGGKGEREHHAAGRSSTDWRPRSSEAEIIEFGIRSRPA